MLKYSLKVLDEICKSDIELAGEVEWDDRLGKESWAEKCLGKSKVMTSVSAHMDDMTKDGEEERGANKGSVSQSVSQAVGGG